MNFERFIKEFNLATTLTITDRKEFCRVNPKFNEIDYSNSISFYQLVELFNKLYLEFEKDYKEIKQGLGEYMFFSGFYQYDNTRYAMIYLDNPIKEICDYEETLLNITETDGKFESFITNDINPFDKNFYRKSVELDEELSKQYLDFLQKHDCFLQSYYLLKNHFIFGNGTTVLFSSIEGELLEKLKTFVLSFGNNYFNTADSIEILFNLGEELSIDYDSCKIVMDLKKIENKKQYIDELVNNLFINRSKLPVMYEKGKCLVKEIKK